MPTNSCKVCIQTQKRLYTHTVCVYIQTHLRVYKLWSLFVYKHKSVCIHTARVFIYKRMCVPTNMGFVCLQTQKRLYTNNTLAYIQTYVCAYKHEFCLYTNRKCVCIQTIALRVYKRMRVSTLKINVCVQAKPCTSTSICTVCIQTSERIYKHIKFINRLKW